MHDQNRLQVLGQIDSLFLPFCFLRTTCSLFSIELHQHQNQISYMQSNLYKFGEIRFRNGLLLELGMYTLDGRAGAVVEIHNLYEHISSADQTITIMLQHQNENVSKFVKSQVFTIQKQLETIVKTMRKDDYRVIAFGVGMKQDFYLIKTREILHELIDFVKLEQNSVHNDESEDPDPDFTLETNKLNEQIRLDVGLRILQNNQTLFIPKFNQQTFYQLKELFSASKCYSFNQHFNTNDYSSFKLKNNLYSFICYNEYSKFYRKHILLQKFRSSLFYLLVANKLDETSFLEYKTQLRNIIRSVEAGAEAGCYI